VQWQRGCSRLTPFENASRHAKRAALTEAYWKPPSIP
jgi:hypothetical protein